MRRTTPDVEPVLSHPSPPLRIDDEALLKFITLPSNIDKLFSIKEMPLPTFIANYPHYNVLIKECSGHFKYIDYDYGDETTSILTAIYYRKGANTVKVMVLNGGGVSRLIGMFFESITTPATNASNLTISPKVQQGINAAVERILMS